MKQQITLNIKNFPAQQAVFDHVARFKIVAKGRRFGLTKGAANDYIRCALQRSFKKGFWGDTVNANIDRYVERYFIPEIRKLPDDMWQWKKQQRILYILDSYIDFRSADNPENWEGFGYDKSFLNEAGIILKNEYLWYNAVRPMLMEFKPISVIGGTPKGRGLFHELYLKGNDKDNKEYKSFHYTTYDNPYLDKKEIDQMKDDMPEQVAKQEIYAQFLEDVGVVFRGVKDVMNAQPLQPVKGHLYVMGVDLAKVQDYTVITVYDRSTRSQVYQDRFKELDWNYQKKKIAVVCKHYNNALISIDASGLGDPIADDLARAGLPVEPIKITNESKREMIEKLAIWIEQRNLSILDIEETLQELTDYSYDISKSGKIVYNAPEGSHDDIVISHALAVWQLYDIKKERPKQKSIIRQELEHRRRIQTYGYDPEVEIYF